MDMLSLIRRDSALRASPLWLLLSLLTANVLLGVMAYAAARGNPMPQGIYFAVIWVVISLFFIFGRIEARCSDMDLALPIPARRLWLAHLIATFLAGFAIAAFVAACTALILWLLWLASRGTFVMPALTWGLFAQVAAAVLLSAVLLQSRRLAWLNPGRDARQLLATLANQFLVLVLGLLLVERSPVTALLPLALAMGLFLRSLRALPASFSTERAAAAEARTQEDAKAVAAEWSLVGRTRGPAYEWFLFATVFRSIAKNLAKGLILLPFLFGFGLLLSDGIPNPGFHELRYTLVLITSFMYLAVLGASVPYVHRLDALPISRRMIFAAIMLPSLASLCLGYGLGRWMAGSRQTAENLVEIVENTGIYSVKVPLESCEITWDGQVPPNRTPWGEIHAAWSTPLYRGSTARLYSPYSTHMDSSPEYFAYQLSRAIDAVYDRQVPPNAVKERWLKIEGGAWVTPKQRDVPLMAGLPDLAKRPSGPVFPLMILVIALLWLSPAVLFLRSFRPGVNLLRRRILYFGLVIVFVGLHFLQYVAFMKNVITPYVLRGCVEISVRNLTESLPGGSITVYALCIAGFIGVYHLLERRFERVEVLPGEEITLV